MRSTFAFCASLVSALVGISSLARADEASRRAETLFVEGKTALEAGRFDEACPKLAESQRLDPAAGTLLALGLCHEGQGKTATAWRELGAAGDLSERNGRHDRVTLARAHVGALEPKLSRLTVAVSDAGVEVRVDGSVLPESAWGSAIPIDPGDHTIEASLGATRHWSGLAHVGPDGDARVVVVPKFPVILTPRPSAPEAPPAHHDHTLAYVVGGAGIVVLGVGAFFGVRALGDRSDANALCSSSPCANAAGVSDNDHAKTAAWVADFGVGVGLAAVAVGGYLVFRPSGARGTTARLAPGSGGAPAGATLSVVW